MKEDKERCVFCKILEGKLESSRVYEDGQAVVLMDIQPINPGHMLVVPKQHVPYIDGLDAELGAHLFKIGMNLNRVLRKSTVRCEGVNYFLADGQAANQDVFHVHLHVFPRFKKDGFGLKFRPDYAERPPRETLDRIAAEIKTLLM